MRAKPPHRRVFMQQRPVSPLRCELSRCRRSLGPTRHHGVLRSDPAVVPHVRFSLRSPAQAPTGPAGRDLVPGRGLRHHPGTAALSLACRRSRWRRHRYPRPVAARLPGCHTLFPQAVEGPGASAWAVGHRQAEQLQGGAPNGDAVCRPSHGPIREQSRRSLPPAHTTTRATHATVQISRSGTTLLVRARTRPQPFPRWPSPGASGASSRAPRSLFPHLGCSHNRRLTRVEITIPSTGSLDERELDNTRAARYFARRRSPQESWHRSRWSCPSRARRSPAPAGSR